jgi:hypothetical protein
MFGSWFYNKRVRTAVSVFGSIFNNLHVLRQNSAGETISQVKVPLSYAPKRSFIERLQEMQQGEDAERRVAIKLPRMSFEITNLAYDAERQLPKVNKFARSGTDVSKKKRFYTSVPYTMGFQLNVYAKSQDDALQIVEQVIPYFNPQYTLSIKPFTDYTEIVEDVPIILNGITFSDDFEGSVGQRRTIIYTLDFEMKMSFYGPEKESSIIREVDTNFFLKEEGFNDSDLFVERLNITPSPTNVSPDSDYGFNELLYDIEK